MLIQDHTVIRATRVTKICRSLDTPLAIPISQPLMSLTKFDLYVVGVMSFLIHVDTKKST